MVRVRADLDDVRTFVDSYVEPGTWRAKVLKINEEESSTGNPMLTWDWQVREGPSKGEEIRSWTSLLDDALGSFKNHVNAFGYDGKVDVETKDIERGRCPSGTTEAMIVVAMRKRRNGRDGDEEARPTIIAVRPLEERGKRRDDDDDDDRRPSRNGNGRSSRRDDDDDDDDKDRRPSSRSTSRSRDDDDRPARRSSAATSRSRDDDKDLPF